MTRTLKRICVLTSILMASAVASFAQDAKTLAKTLPVPDERYKLDILLVVAHPDDEAAATAYLARAMDEGKRAGVAYGTRGSSGANEAGTEQAAALGDIREIEARRALAKLGISDVWFIGGRDTASQDVLQSLSSWDHGAVLEQMVRNVWFLGGRGGFFFFPPSF